MPFFNHKKRNQMKKTLLIIYCLLAVSSISAQVTIVENTRERFVFEWAIDAIDTTIIMNENSYSVKASFMGQNTDIGEFKKTVTPGYSFFVGIPVNGDVQVSIIPQTVVPMHLPYPLKLQSDSSRQLPLVFQSQWISDPSFSSIGAFRTAQCVIRPVAYNPATGDCSVMLKGKVTIVFPTANAISVAKTESRLSMVMSKLLLNYQIARNWASAGKLDKRKVELYPLSTAQDAFCFKIGDGHKGLSESTINENGVIKITGVKLKELFGTSSQLLISRVALYASNKGMLTDSIPAKGAIPDGIKEVPMLRYDINGNGFVDNEDYCLAYVSGANDWKYKHTHLYNINYYDDQRAYWLTVKSQSGMTFTKFTQPSGAFKSYTHFKNRLYCKAAEGRDIKSEGGNEWIWKKLYQGDNTFKYTFDIPLIDTLFPGYLTMIGDTSSFAVRFSDTVLTKDSTSRYFIRRWGNRSLNIEYKSDDVLYLKDLEFTYQSKLNVQMGKTCMTVFCSDDSGVVNYNLSGVKDQRVFVFRISADDLEIALIDTISSAVSDTFTWADSGRSQARYFICNDSGFLSFPQIVTQSDVGGKFVCNDLRNTSNTTDYLIISHPDFISESIRLAAHKKQIGFKNPCIVSIDKIYQLFSGGNKDPVAIRNFIVYVKRNWTNGSELFYALLMGNGHYDPKNYKHSATDFIPIFQEGTLLHEDFFTYTELQDSSSSRTVPQLVIGRFPCNTASQAAAMVTKVIEMEDPSTADFGAWRNRALFVADDDMQGNDYDPIMNQTPHYKSSDRVVDLGKKKWPSLDVRKAYLFDYEWNAALEKPEATQAITSEINNGVAYVNYFGHGSESLWADEHILRIPNIASMTNSKQYPLITSFSCDVGRFDIPGEECLSGALVKESGAGACVTISSTRLAYASENEALALSFYGNLMDSSATQIGNAFYRAKVVNSSSGHHAYALLGDPSLQMVAPGKSVQFDIVDKNGAHIDTLSALQEIKIKGKILKSDNTVDSDFGNGTVNAYVKLSLFNAPDSASRKDGGDDNSIRYLMPGTPVFIGKTAVSNGVFEQKVYLPKNLSYDKKGVVLTGYAWKEKVRDAAVGVDSDIIFHGTITDSSTQNDPDGPRISIRPLYDNASLAGENISFTDKITSMLPLKFQIDLYDESGIDVSGSGPNEGLIIEIPGVISKKNMNSKFQFSEGDFREGNASVEIEENSLSPGDYELNIYAQDLVGNISLKKIKVEITEQEEIKLNQVFNYPNPFRMGQTTRFYFYSSNTTSEVLPVSIYVKIYTLSGKPIRIFTNASNGMVWDGRDQAGNLLSPNVYLFQVTACNTSYQDRKTIKSKIKKIVIHPPR